jgi:DNA-binding beta-propeller fold protein YncE
MKSTVLFHWAIALSFALGLLNGCSSSNQGQKDLIWPDPPDKPRIKYLRTYRSEDDFGGNVLNKLTKSLAGANMKVSLSRPFDVCADGEGQIFVTDLQSGVIRIDEMKHEFTPLGEKSRIPLINPRGIACAHGKLFIGLPSLGQIGVFTYDGEDLYTIGKKREFPNPLDIVVDTIRSRVYVVDNKLHNITVFSEKGDSLFTIGQRGVDDGTFNFPQAAAVDSAGNLYVADAFNFRIQKFDSTGKFLLKFGKQGDDWGNFAIMKGIAVDSYGNIYVLDGSHQHFQVFDPTGTLLLFVGKFSTRNDGFQNPVSICIDKHNTIYVTDQLNERVQVFQLLNGM